jgi:hypothetical protein
MPVGKRLLGVLVLMLLVPCLAAAAPLGSGFTYQGELSQSGTPVDGTVHLRFSLWDAAGSGTPPAGGTQIGASQIITSVPVSGGLFSVLVNAGGEFGAQSFDGQARWLQIEVCSDTSCSSSTTLGPRQPLTAAPYSLGPWHLAATNLSYAGGNVGIGTTSPEDLFHVNGGFRWGGSNPKYAYTGIDGSGLFLEQKGNTANTSRFRLQTSKTGDQVNYAQLNIDPYNGISLLAQGNGNPSLGIGVQAPTEKLDVRGNIKLGASGEYYAPGGQENLRIIRGKVSSTGAVLLGSGFTASRSATGVYSITFSPSYPASSNYPIVTATAESSGAAHFAMINFPSYIACTIRVVNGSGTAVDSDFYFIAVGPR